MVIIVSPFLVTQARGSEVVGLRVPISFVLLFHGGGGKVPYAESPGAAVGIMLLLSSFSGGLSLQEVSANGGTIGHGRNNE